MRPAISPEWLASGRDAARLRHPAVNDLAGGRSPSPQPLPADLPD